MTKQLIALALAAAFGIAHAADTKPAPVKVAADTTQSTTSQSKVGGADAATGKSPEMKTDMATTTTDKATTKTRKHTHKRMHKKSAPRTDAAATGTAK
ncbi:MAG TPA: hypothetical protein VFF03_16090 [Rhodocyclaceae bacterium]|nr:hypothetical protein [Rhodocyclaceae bacterium]